jgi:hypothetical protein
MLAGKLQVIGSVPVICATSQVMQYMTDRGCVIHLRALTAKTFFLPRHVRDMTSLW